MILSMSLLLMVLANSPICRKRRCKLAAPETELPLEETSTTKGILSFPLILFLFDHANVVLILAWMSFAEAATTIEGANSSCITEMIEETHLEGAKAPKISDEEVSASTTAVTRESFQRGDLP